MPLPELERLVDTGLLEREPPVQKEFDGLVAEATVLLRDSRSEQLSVDSRFRLAYGSAHAIALAALRAHGYRPRNRQIVFQALAHTLGAPAATWRMLARSHQERNKREYEGGGEISNALLRDVTDAAETLLRDIESLRPPADQE